MDFAKVKGKTDEWYTPASAVEPIIKYITQHSVVWCPFDTEESNFVKLLRQRGFQVISSHIDEGQDFFTYEPKQWDIIVSNPPYSIRNEILAKAISFNKPFALLMNTNGLFDSKIRFDMFKAINFSLYYLRGRVNYMKEYGLLEKSSPPFQSAYICRGLSNDKIIFQD